MKWGSGVKKICSVIILLVQIIFLLVTPVTGSDDWVKYFVDEYGNVLSYKKVNIDKDGGKFIVQVWEKDVFSDKSKEKIINYSIKHGLFTEGYNKLSYEMCLLEIDCKKQKYNLLSYFYGDTDEKFLYNSESRDKSGWRDIAPNSRVDILQKKVCE